MRGVIDEMNMVIMSDLIQDSLYRVIPSSSVRCSCGRVIIVIDTSVDGLFLNNNECDEYNMNISRTMCCKNDKNDGGMYCMIVRRI